MTEIEYRNRSISQLINELNNLGQANVVLQPVRLLAIHEQDAGHLKRFKNSHGEQFFTLQGNDKKYVYNEIVQNVTGLQLCLLSELYQKGFNTTILFSMPKQQNKLTQLLSEIIKLVGDSAYSAINFTQQQILDIIAQSPLTQKEVQNKLKFYRVKQINSLVFLEKVIRTQDKQGIILIKIRKSIGNDLQNNELNLVVFPQLYFSPNLKSNDYLSIVKSQLTQIFNYIKLNPSKKYQHFSKLLTKRLSATNVIASIVLEKSYSLVVNWMNEGTLQNLAERVSFYQKIRGLSIFLKIEENSQPILSQLPSNLVSLGASKKQNISKSKDVKLPKTERTPISHLLSQEKDLQFCRSFERKTHKYSINDYNEQQLFGPNQQPQPQHRVTYNTPSPVTHNPIKRQKQVQRDVEIKRFDETLVKKNNQNLKQSEEIAILKANHAVEISQYHQTVQQLNRKILALTHSRSLDQLYTLHERELMLLQFKIKELRSDISNLCNGGDEKSYKGMVRKLNQEVKRLENKASEQKVSSARTVLLQKQITELRNKYEQSEAARKKLAYELEYMTKRLKICDAQIENLNSKEVQLTQTTKRLLVPESSVPTQSQNKLPANGMEYLKEVEILLSGIKQGNQNSKMFLVRKITNLLQDLASSRNIILQCNDFLIQLQEHLQQKLGNKQGQIVLDCNKFIRNFLMDNLHIF